MSGQQVWSPLSRRRLLKYWHVREWDRLPACQMPSPGRRGGQKWRELDRLEAYPTTSSAASAAGEVGRGSGREGAAEWAFSARELTTAALSRALERLRARPFPEGEVTEQRVSQFLPVA
jgi:hypothetical protein